MSQNKRPESTRRSLATIADRLASLDKRLASLAREVDLIVRKVDAIAELPLQPGERGADVTDSDEPREI